MTCSKDGRYRGSTARRESMNKLFSIPGISYTSSSVNLDTMGCFFNFLREFRQCNRQNPVFQTCLDAVFFDPFHIELAAEDRAGTFTADVMTVIIFFLRLFLFLSGQGQNSVFIRNTDLILGKPGHITGNFIEIFFILNIHLGYRYIIFVCSRSIAEEMIQRRITEKPSKGSKPRIIKTSFL